MGRETTSHLRAVAVGAVTLVIIFVTSAFGQEISDPYVILDEYFEAAGGLDRLKAERTQYFEGTLSLGGMQGSIRVWTEKPERSRTEVEIGPLRTTQGDNGEVSWVLDTNGKLQKTTKFDEATLKRRDVDRRIAEFEYANRNSDVFSVGLEDRDEVDGTACYVLSVTNNINTDREIYYVSIDGFRLLKRVTLRGEDSADTYYGDYRKVDGLLVAFYSKEIEHQTGQPQEVVVSRYESDPEIEAALFDPPEQRAKDYEFTAGGAAENIPFRFEGNHLFIPVVINGVERLWVLDTGAAVNVVDKAFADAMGLETEGDIKGVGAGGTVDVSFAVLPPFEVEGIRFGTQTVAVIDMSELIRRVGIDVVGILGFDFLSRFVTKVDYANQRVSFYDPDLFNYAGDGRSVDVRVKESVFETPAVLDGTHAGTWMFDVGASTTGLDGRYALREGYANRAGVITVAHGAANEYQVKAVKGDSIEFAGFTVYRPAISFPYGGTDTVFTGDSIGRLGNTLFRNFVVYVDYARERVILEKGEKFNQAWPEDNSGLSVGWTIGRDGVEVIYVSPGTPAEAAGFQKGDVLKSLNGMAVEPRDGVITVRNLLKRAPGTVYEVVADREGSQQTFRLTLADLY
jgi:hypothetical protein